MNRFDSAFPTKQQGASGVSWIRTLLLSAFVVAGILGSVSANAQVFRFGATAAKSAANACDGEVITYGVNGLTGNQYQWFVGQNATIIGSSVGPTVTVQWDYPGNMSWGGNQYVQVQVFNNGSYVGDRIQYVTVRPLPTPNIVGAVVACVNNIYTYNTVDNPGYTYQWSITKDPAQPAASVFALVNGSLQTNEISLQWTQTGVHTMAVTETSINGGCAVTYTSTVRVNGVPAPNVTSPTGFGNPVTQQPGRVCANSTHSYSTSPTIGNVFNWTVTGGAITSGQNSSAITVVWGSEGPGTMSVTESVPGSNCSTTANYTVTKSAQPVPSITGQQNPCTQSVQTYTTPNVAGNSYTWNVTGGTVIGGQGTNTISVQWPLVAVNTGASITVTEAVAGVLGGCSTTSGAYAVTIRPLPSTIGINGPASVCAVDLTNTPATNALGYTYQASNPGGVTWAWSITSNGVIVGATNTQSVNVRWFNNTNLATTGTLTNTQTTTFGCVASASYNVTINPLPNPTVSGNRTVCLNTQHGYSTIGVPGNIYTWTVDGGNVIRSGQGTPNVTVEWTLAGSYGLKVTETIAGGCTVVDSISVTVNPLPVATLRPSGNTTFCQGGDVTLHAPVGFSNYNWSTGETSRSIVVRTTGKYWVTLTNGNGCSNSSDTVDVNVFPATLPIIAVSGPTTFCEGETVTLTAPAGFAAYRWSLNGAVLPDNGQSITASKTGAYVVMVADGNGCNGSSTEVDVFVNPKPTAKLLVVGATTICTGDTVEVRAPAGYNNYTWYSENGQNYGNTRSAFVTAADKIYCEVVDANGCVGTSDTVAIEMGTFPAPVVTANGATSFCEGGAVTLTASEGFDSYLWSNGQTGRTITVENAGTFTVVVTKSNALCTVSSKPVNVVENAKPARPMIERNGYTLKAVANGASAFQWYRNGTMMPGAENNELVVNLPGTYRVEIKDGNTCSSLSQPFDVILTNVEEEGVAGYTNDLQVYPNPTNGQVTLEVMSATAGAVRVDVINSLGETVMSFNDVANGGAFNTTMNVSDLATGVYTVVMTSGNDHWSVRMIRQ
jgi:hypothetical protein